MLTLARIKFLRLKAATKAWQSFPEQKNVGCRNVTGKDFAEAST